MNSCLTVSLIISGRKQHGTSLVTDADGKWRHVSLCYFQRWPEADQQYYPDAGYKKSTETRNGGSLSALFPRMQLTLESIAVTVYSQQ